MTKLVERNHRLDRNATIVVFTKFVMSTLSKIRQLFPILIHLPTGIYQTTWNKLHTKGSLCESQIVGKRFGFKQA